MASVSASTPSKGHQLLARDEFTPPPPTKKEVVHISKEELDAHNDWVSSQSCKSTLLVCALIVVFVAASIVPFLVEGYNWVILVAIPVGMVLYGLRASIDTSIESKKKSHHAEQMLRLMEPFDHESLVRPLGYGDLDDALDNRLISHRLFQDELKERRPAATPAYFIEDHGLHTTKRTKNLLADIYAGKATTMQAGRSELVNAVHNARNELLLQKKFKEYEEAMDALAVSHSGVSDLLLQKKFKAYARFKVKQKEAYLKAAFEYFLEHDTTYFPALQELAVRGANHYEPVCRVLIQKLDLNAQKAEECSKGMATLAAQKEAAKDDAEKLKALIPRWNELQSRKVAIEKELKQLRLDIKPYNDPSNFYAFAKEREAVIAGGIAWLQEHHTGHEITYLEYLMAKGTSSSLKGDLERWVYGHFSEKLIAVKRDLEICKKILTKQGDASSAEQNQQLDRLEKKCKTLGVRYKSLIPNATTDCREEYSQLMEKVEELQKLVLSFKKEVVVGTDGIFSSLWKDMTVSTPPAPFKPPSKTLPGRAHHLTLQRQLKQNDDYTMHLAFFQKFYLQWIALIAVIVCQACISSHWVNFGVQMGYLGVMLLTSFLDSCVQSALDETRRLKMQEHLLTHQTPSLLKHLPQVAQANRLGVDLPVNTTASLLLDRGQSGALAPGLSKKQVKAALLRGLPKWKVKDKKIIEVRASQPLQNNTSIPKKDSVAVDS
jgi:hypothetical protein